MADQVREILMTALRAATYGLLPDSLTAKAVAAGDRQLMIDRLKFDSLAWMEFCISIELQSGQELTPVHIEDMRYFFEIEEWLRARL